MPGTGRRREPDNQRNRRLAVIRWNQMKFTDTHLWPCVRTE